MAVLLGVWRAEDGHVTAAPRAWGTNTSRRAVVERPLRRASLWVLASPLAVSVKLIACLRDVPIECHPVSRQRASVMPRPNQRKYRYLHGDGGWRWW
jgi:hypothetical protein